MTKKIKEVDVNLDAFKDYKTEAKLAEEPGQIFGHLSAEDKKAAYNELAIALGIAKAPAEALPAEGQK
jgi:hypothetical protein